MVGRYRKKPVVIEAAQWTGGNVIEIYDFIGSKEIPIKGNRIIIPILEGNHLARKGDFIIKGVAGEFYSCKPAIFNTTYEKVIL